MRRLVKIGEVPPKHSLDVKESRLGIGFEKLDRGLFDPEQAYDKVASLGVKWIRLQSGWERTEREKGVYDFSWLDEITDNLIRRGLRPWLCLCYGNKLYSKHAEAYFGSVGCPPVGTETERAAWDAYVTATVRHFKGRIGRYEIWNEPDQPYSWRHADTVGVKGEPDGKEYGEFAIRTAKAIKAADPDAKVFGFGIGSCKDLSFFFAAMDTGVAKYIDAVTYHTYTTKLHKRTEYFHILRDIIDMYDPSIRLIQGESGAQSGCSAAGALWGMNLTPAKQLCMVLRQMIIDLALDTEFCSYFSSLDMAEALNATTSDAASRKDYAYFGLIAAEFDENGVANGKYTEKPSYFAMRTLASLFAGDFKVKSLPCRFTEEACRYVNGFDLADPARYSFILEDGSKALVYWNPVDPLTATYEGTVCVEMPTAGDIELIDLRNGDIYSIPDDMAERTASTTFLKHIPVYDFPVMLRWK